MRTADLHGVQGNQASRRVGAARDGQAAAGGSGAKRGKVKGPSAGAASVKEEKGLVGEGQGQGRAVAAAAAAPAGSSAEAGDAELALSDWKVTKDGDHDVWELLDD